MFAQKYMMVYAPVDLYVDLQNNNGERIGQVFNFEVVYVENEPVLLRLLKFRHITIRVIFRAVIW